MTEAEQVQHFCDELDRLVDRCASEFDLPYASIIGALQIKIHNLCVDCNSPDDDDEERPSDAT